MSIAKIGPVNMADASCICHYTVELNMMLQGFSSIYVYRVMHWHLVNEHAKDLKKQCVYLL